MNNVLRFKRLMTNEQPVEIEFNGLKLLVEEGGNLAAELLASNFSSFRKTPVSGAARGPFCMMGACYDCLVEIDGVTQQACMVQVSKGMIIRPAHGKIDERS